MQDPKPAIAKIAPQLPLPPPVRFPLTRATALPSRREATAYPWIGTVPRGRRRARIPVFGGFGQEDSSALTFQRSNEDVMGLPTGQLALATFLPDQVPAPVFEGVCFT